MPVVFQRFLAALTLVACAGCVGGSAATARRMSWEDALLYHPQPFTDADDREEDFQFETARIVSNDGLQLHGWFRAAERPTAVVLYCHGNAGNIASRRWVIRLFRDHLNCSVLIFDYRGYGKSEGVPSEAGLLADARAARRWLAERTGTAESEVVLVGTSLGGAVAVDLAANDGARGLILGNTFTSLPDVASSHLLGLPTRWLMKNRFDSEAKIAGYRGPLLQTHGDADGVVPFKLGRRLFNAANEPKELVVVPGGGHNDPPGRELVQALRRFLDSLPTTADRPKAP
jgi:fermentation-respiration switch protein FrsA (DUF1100 family)